MVERQPRSARLLRLLVLSTFLIFFQAYMVAPVVPSIAAELDTSVRMIGWAIPAYLIPYGIMSLVYGALSDRIGRGRILYASLAAFVLLTGLTATASTPAQLVGWRALTGIGASGVVPLALTLVGDLFPYNQRGRPLGWIFGAMAGGSAAGATLGGLLHPFIGWRGCFLLVALLGSAVLIRALHQPHTLPLAPPAHQPGARSLLAGYAGLLLSRRGARTYLYVLINGVFHAGVYSWLGWFFVTRFGLSAAQIGMAMVGYGLPGLLLGPAIGRAVDRFGRRLLLPCGFMIAAAAALLLARTPSVAGAVLAIALLSLGFDMSQPLLAGIVTALGQAQGRGGQAMGLNVFTLYVGFGLGSLGFGEIVHRSAMPVALVAFATLQLTMAVAALALFRDERAAGGLGRAQGPAPTLKGQVS